MIKNKIKFINLLIIFTLSLFILSCSSDTPAPTDSTTTPITFDGEWTSGSLSYHIDTDCASDGLSLDDFTDSTIASNFEIHAWELANLLCDGDGWQVLQNDEGEEYISEQQCVEDNQIDHIDDLIEDLSEEDFLNYQSRISSGYEYDNMILTIFEDPDIYSVSYSGQCSGYDDIDPADCTLLFDAGYADENCGNLTKEGCLSSVVNGTWDDGFEGSWADGNVEGTYILEDFEMFDELNKNLIFDETSIFIIIDSNEDECLCDEGMDPLEMPTGSSECVLDSQCIWIEKNCVSLSFSK